MSLDGTPYIVHLFFKINFIHNSQPSIGIMTIKAISPPIVNVFFW